jgi:dienelactone hydrolase
MGDFFAQHGYATIMPDYRGYGGSDSGPNPLRIGYALDVLNVIESLHLIIGLDPERVGVVGHSMGGGVTTYVMALSERVDAVTCTAYERRQSANWQHSRYVVAHQHGPVCSEYGAARESELRQHFAHQLPDRVHARHHPPGAHHQVPLQWSVIC